MGGLVIDFYSTMTAMVIEDVLLLVRGKSRKGLGTLESMHYGRDQNKKLDEESGNHKIMAME